MTPITPASTLLNTSALTPAFTLSGTGDFVDLGDPPAGSGFRSTTESRTLPSGSEVSLNLWQADRRAGESWIEAYNRFTVDYTVATANQTGIAPFMSFEDFVASNVYAQELKVSVDAILKTPSAPIPDRVTSMVVNLPEYTLPEMHIELCDTVGKRLAYGWGELTKDWPSELHAAGGRFLDALPYALGVIGAAFLIGGLAGATAAVMGYLAAAGLGILAMQAGAIVGFLLDIAFGCVNKSDVDRSVALIKPTFYNTVVGVAVAATGYGALRVLGPTSRTSSATSELGQTGGPVTYVQNAAGQWVRTVAPMMAEELVLGADGVYGPASAPVTTPSALPATTTPTLPAGAVPRTTPGLTQGHIPAALPANAAQELHRPSANTPLTQVLQNLPPNSDLEVSVPLIGPGRGHVANVRFNRNDILNRGLPETLTWEQFTDMLSQLLSFGTYRAVAPEVPDIIASDAPMPGVDVDLSGVTGPHLLPGQYYVTGTPPASGLSTPIGLEVDIIPTIDGPARDNTVWVNGLHVNAESPISWGTNHDQYPTTYQEQPHTDFPPQDHPVVFAPADPDVIQEAHDNIIFDTTTDPANPEALGGGAIPVNRGALRMDITTAGHGVVSIEASAAVMNASTLPPGQGIVYIERVISEGVILGLNSCEPVGTGLPQTFETIVSTPEGHYMMQMLYDPVFRVIEVIDLMFERNRLPPPSRSSASEPVQH